MSWTREYITNIKSDIWQIDLKHFRLVEVTFGDIIIYPRRLLYSDVKRC